MPNARGVVESKFFRHQVVHNGLFDTDQDADKHLASVYVTSTHQKHTALYSVGMNELIELLEESTQL